MKSLLLFILIMVVVATQIHAQGCVAIRSTGGLCTMDHSAKMDKPEKWVFNINNRYYKSFRHFVGTKEQKQRVQQGTEVINHSYTLDLGLSRNLNKWWSIAVDVPIVSNARSSLYEHDGKTRHSTHSFGIGDVRFTAYRWII